MATNLKLIRDRDAWATVRGYVYQIETTILRWLDLQDEEVIELERGEDIDVVGSQLRTLEQIKVREKNLTLKSKESNEALASFYEHLSNNPALKLRYRFVTNAKNGKENSPWNLNENGIDVWRSIREGRLLGDKLSVAIESIRKLLSTNSRPKNFNKLTWDNWIKYLKNCSEIDFLNFINKFEWSIHNSDPKYLKDDIENKILNKGHAKNSSEANSIYQNLFCYLFRTMSSNGLKRISMDTFNEVINSFKPSANEYDIFVLINDLTSKVANHEIRISEMENIIYSDSQPIELTWNVPFKVNPNFVGRELVLKEIRDRLESGNIEEIIQIITGIGGVGKTQLVVHYAHHYRKQYKLIWWINAESEETIKLSLSDLGTVLHIETENIDEKVKKVLLYLSNNKDYLLIFDNANKFSVVDKFLPNPQTGHVLITSRSQNNWIKEPITLSQFTTPESVRFLMKRTGFSDAHQGKEAEILANELGNLPLALEHAGAYIKNKRKTFEDYLSMYRQRKLEFLTAEGTPYFYHSTILTTWNISLEIIKEESEIAIDILQIMSFLGADNIPMAIVFEYVRGLEMDEFEKDKVIEVLVSYSLIIFSIKERYASMHRLVQEVIKYRMSDQTFINYLNKSNDMISEKFIFNQYISKSWEECRKLLPHVLVLVEENKKRNIVNKEVIILLYNLGLFYNHFANYLEARESLNLAKEYAETIKFNAIGGILNALSLTSMNLDDNAAAELYINQALEMHKTEDKFRAILLSNKATLLMNVNKEYHLAFVLFSLALEIEHEIYQCDNQHTAVTRNNMAECLKSMGNYEEAKLHLETTIEIERQIQKQTNTINPNLATRLSNYGGALLKLNLVDEAISSYEEALSILDQIFINDDYRKAFVMSEYSGALMQAGRYVEAFNVVKKASEMLTVTLGEQHKQTKEVKLLLLTIGMLLKKV